MEELERLAGVTGIKDLHRESIDHITIPSREGKGRLKRVEEVFDCWFESGRFVCSSRRALAIIETFDQYAMGSTSLSL